MIATIHLTTLDSSPESLALATSQSQCPATVYLETLGSGVSKRTMISPLNRAAMLLNPALLGKDAWRSIPWVKLTAPVVRALMGKLVGSPATRNKALAALKGVARAAWELRSLDTEELLRIQSIKGDAGSREPAGRYVPTGEISALLHVCSEDPTPAGARDAAMISLAAATGARRAEIAAISAFNASYVPEEGRYTIRVIGKRNKERTLHHLTGNAARALADWLSMRGDFTRCIVLRGSQGRHDLGGTADFDHCSRQNPPQTLRRCGCDRFGLARPPPFDGQQPPRRWSRHFYGRGNCRP